MQELIILTHVGTDSVNEGFLPAAQRLGLSVIVLTDQAESHRQYFSQSGLSAYPDEIISCDVFNPIAVMEAVLQRTRRPAAIFSNSDHLQTSAAIAAKYLDLPGKDWQVTYRAKNKAEMRHFLKAQGLDTLWHGLVWDKQTLQGVLDQIPYPCIIKPHEGVGSQQVYLAHSTDELVSHCEMAWMLRPGQLLLIEEYLVGPLYTLESLGDGQRFWSLGGFQVVLSPPPHFVELEAHWGVGPGAKVEQQVLEQISRFGVNFGACHTEFILTDAGPRLVEINYRSIGDYRDFLIQDALGFDYFETILRLHQGMSVETLHKNSRVATIRYFTSQHSGQIITAPEAFSLETTDHQTLEYRSLRKMGEMVSQSFSNKDYLGVLWGTGSDATSLNHVMQRASEDLQWEIKS